MQQEQAGELDQATVDRLDDFDREILEERVGNERKVGPETVTALGMIPLSEAASRSSKSHGALRLLCEQDRIPGAIKEVVGSRERWMVPADFTDESITGVHKVGKARLSERQKNNIARAYKDGTKSGGELAKQYGVDPSYPRKLVLRGYPKK